MSDSEKIDHGRRNFIRDAGSAAAITVLGFTMGCEAETSRDPKNMKENLNTLKSFIESYQRFQTAELSKARPDVVAAHEHFLYMHFSKLKYNEIAQELNKRAAGTEAPIKLYEISKEHHEWSTQSTNNSLYSGSRYVPKLK